jgi:hypothetical protein
MKQKEIIKIINTKDNWDSKELIKFIKSENKKQVNITFCWIGGYELLKDGTRKEKCKSLEDVQDVLSNWDFEYDNTITDPYELVKSIEKEWEDMRNDGGGSGWIEY